MKSLKLKVLVFVTSIIILVVTVIGSVAYARARIALRGTVMHLLEITASNASTIVSDQNEKELVFLRSIASMKLFRDRNVSMDDKVMQLQFLWASKADKYERFVICDENGIGYIGGGYTFDFNQTSKFMLSESREGREFVSNPAYIEESNDIQMFYSVPLYDLDNKFAGTIMGVLKGDWMTQIVNSITIGKNSHPVLISMRTGEEFSGITERRQKGEDEVKIHTKDDNSEYGRMISKALNGESGEYNYVDPFTGIRMCSYYMPVKGPGNLTVVAAAPYDDYFSHLSRMRSVIIIVILISVGLTGALTVHVVHFIIKPLFNLKGSILDIASGSADLTQRITVTSSDEIGAVVNGFNSFTEKMQNIVAGIKGAKQELYEAGQDLSASTEDTTNSISEIIDNISSVHQQINQQSESVHQTAGAVNEIASNIESLERMIETQSSEVHEASAAVQQMISNIDSVNLSVDRMANSFEHLTSSAKEGSELQLDVNGKIEQIKNQSETLQEANLAISSIAEQTNLLAMNAAIEAAHAGEAGKGFSVVADEIRKLSETSSQQSKTIGEQLTHIGGLIDSVVDASQRSSSAFLAVINEIRDTDEVVRVIKSAMEEQTNGSRQINQALHEMNDSTMEVRTAGHEMSEGNKAILEEVKNLQDSTGVMLTSMDEMTLSATKIRETGNALDDIARKMNDSIGEIGNKIDEFKV